MNEEVAHGEAAALLAVVTALLVDLNASGTVDGAALCARIVAASDKYPPLHPLGVTMRTMAETLAEALAGRPPPALSVVEGDKPD